MKSNNLITFQFHICWITETNIYTNIRTHIITLLLAVMFKKTSKNKSNAFKLINVIIIFMYYLVYVFIF